MIDCKGTPPIRLPHLSAYCPRPHNLYPLQNPLSKSMTEQSNLVPVEDWYFPYFHSFCYTIQKFGGEIFAVVVAQCFCALSLHLLEQ